MKLFLAIVVLLVAGSSADAGALQAASHRVVSPPPRYWLSDDLNRLVFWQVRDRAQDAVAPGEAHSR